MKSRIRCAIVALFCVGILLPSTVFAYNVFVTPAGTTHKYVGDDVNYHAECLYCYGPHELTWVNNWDCLTDTTSVDNTTWIDMYGTANTPGAYTIMATCRDDYHGTDAETLIIRNLTAGTTETTKILADDGLAGDQLGYAVCIDGDTAIVGAPYDDNNEGNDSGSAYIYVRSGDNWEEETKLTASTEGALGDRFGHSVFLDDDTAIIGAPYDDDGGSSSGSAYVFVRSGATWSKQAKLHASDPASDDVFGYSVSVSNDYAIVSAHADDDYGSACGSAYIFVRSGTSWSEETKLHASDAASADLFGYAVAIDDPYAAVGALGNDDCGGWSGSAYVFVRNGTAWSEQTKLLASDGEVGDRLGSSVAINDPYVIVGAENSDDFGEDTGSAYIYSRVGDSWSQKAKLTASDGVTDDLFGQSVAINDYLAVVGASGYMEESGTAYLFARTGDNWTEVSRLVASDTEAGDEFGFAVSIGDDYALIGAPGDDDKGTDAGAAYMFDIDELMPEYETKMLLGEEGAGDVFDEGEDYDQFGFSLDIEGDQMIIGAPGDNNGGSAFIYKRTSTGWTEEFRINDPDCVGVWPKAGASVAIDGDRAIIGVGDQVNNFQTSPSCAFIYARTSTGWIEETCLNPSDFDEGDFFGTNVDINGNYALVSGDGCGGFKGRKAYVFVRTDDEWVEETQISAQEGTDPFIGSMVVDGNYAYLGYPGDDNGDNYDVGSVCIYKRNGSDWDLQQKVWPSVFHDGGKFGCDLAVSGDTMVVGCLGYGGVDPNDEYGAAYIFERTGENWSEETKITLSDSNPADQFGIKVDVDGDTFIASRLDNDIRTNKPGAVWVYTKTVDDEWQEVTEIQASDGYYGDYFGTKGEYDGSVSRAIGISGSTVAVGAPDDDNENGTDAGSVYIYDISD